MSVEELREFTDETIRPQDDLFGHVNGRWLETAEIPADLPMTGGFIDLRQQAEADVGDILRDASDAAADGSAARGTNRQKIGDLFASFMDDDRIEALGHDPIAADLAASRRGGRHERARRACWDGWPATGWPARSGATSTPTTGKSDRYIVNLVQGGIGLPDESYYREEPFAEIRDGLRRTTSPRCSDSSAGTTPLPTDGAQRVMALETRLAAGHWDRVRTRDVIDTYNLTTLDELRAAAPAFDWSGWIDGARSAPESAFAEVRGPPARLPRGDVGRARRRCRSTTGRRGRRSTSCSDAAPLLSHRVRRGRTSTSTRGP